jgi:pilus assembly protein Flp/PilA
VNLKLRLARGRSKNEVGATAVEYGLILALIAGVIIGTVTLLSSPVTGLFSSVKWWP